MELEGINLDKEFLENLSGDLDNDIKSLETDIYEKAGETFNIASPKQLGEILFDKLKLIDKPKKTKAVDVRAMGFIAHRYGVVR